MDVYFSALCYDSYMETLTGENIYISLFIVSFLAATIIPLGSEWLLISIILAGGNAPLSVAIASLGNYLGGLSNYLIGFFGGTWVIRKLLKINEEKEGKARALYTKYGSWSLLLTWLPIIGDPLCLMGGMMKTGLIRFTILVFTGKLARYSALAFATKEGMALVSN